VALKNTLDEVVKFLDTSEFYFEDLIRIFATVDPVFTALPMFDVMWHHADEIFWYVAMLYTKTPQAVLLLWGTESEVYLTLVGGTGVILGLDQAVFWAEEQRQSYLYSAYTQGKHFWDLTKLPLTKLNKATYSTEPEPLQNIIRFQKYERPA